MRLICWQNCWIMTISYDKANRLVPRGVAGSGAEIIPWVRDWSRDHCKDPLHARLLHHPRYPSREIITSSQWPDPLVLMLYDIKELNYDIRISYFIVCSFCPWISTWQISNTIIVMTSDAEKSLGTRINFPNDKMAAGREEKREF